MQHDGDDIKVLVTPPALRLPDAKQVDGGQVFPLPRAIPEAEREDLELIMECVEV